MPKAEPEPPRQPTEEERVISNVEYHLRELGFNTIQAEALAAVGVDWHRAKHLLDSGCSHETAVDILL